jgi:hypothetical protein
VLVVAALVVGGILFALEGNRRGEDDDSPDRNALVLNGLVFNQKGNEERAFRLVLSRGVWAGNDKLKRGLKAVVGLERADPEAALLAVAAQDYGTKMPRDAELLQGAIGRLEGYFGENLELGERPEPGELAGRPAQVLPFRGSAGGVQWEGECHMTARHGLGYWLFVGAPSREAAQQVLAGLQGDRGRGLVLSDERPGWSEQPPKLLLFAGRRAPFTVRGREGVWQSFAAVKEVDPNAKLFLLGRDPEDRKDNLRTAAVLVLALDQVVPDLEAALAAARDYLEASKKQEGKGYQIVSAADKKGKAGEAGAPRQIGNRPGQVAELRLVRDGVPVKYLLLGVVRTPERIYVFDCEAHWPHRQAWRRDFLDLLATFRLV